ncbi:MAG: N-acetylmuramic acid 6-phosphate etherase [Nocardioidaceae bacterium]
MKAANPAGEHLGDLVTEATRPELDDLDRRSTSDLVRLMIDEQVAVDQALRAASPQLEAVVDAVAHRIGGGGRLVYLGAGTPGRLAAVDAAECPPTFGVPPETVVALVAGGPRSMAGAREGAEDDAQSGAMAVRWAHVGPDDVVVGISASGRTPYVVAGLVAARETGALAVAIVNNAGSAMSAVADLTIELPTGPEVLAGSTRLKAGTAQKVVLNALSTLVMVRTGHTFGNLMVDVRASNAKLHDRALRILAQATGCTDADAQRALVEADDSVKVAVVMLRAGLNAAAARDRLERSGSVRQAIDDA